MEVAKLPSEEEAKAMHVNLQKHINLIRSKMIRNEEALMQNSAASIDKIRECYAEAERLTKMYNWLTGVEYNRYVYPIEVLKAQAAQKQAQPKQIIAEA